MTDTEQRLRDYLETKAATIPANTPGPGLLEEAPRRRPVWPVLATAAAVAAVLALTITGLTHLNADKPAPASTPAPRDGVPVTVFNAKGNWTLYDGNRTLVQPPDIGSIRARVGDGWLATYEKEPHSQNVILQADGTHRPIGPDWGGSPVISPDGKQIAMIVYEERGDDSGRLAVFDIASGAEVASAPLPTYRTDLSGWNATGIWIYSHDFGPPWKAELRVWRLGTTLAPLQVPVGQGLQSVSTRSSTDTVVLTKGSDKESCVEAGSLQNGRLEIEREYCGLGAVGAYPALSPDGKSVLLPTAKLVLDIASGKTTKLKTPEPIIGFPLSVFESATQVLVVTQRVEGGKDPQRLYRCDVGTGTCKVIRTEKSGNRIALITP